MVSYQKSNVLNTPGMEKLRQFVQKRVIDEGGGGDFQSFERELHAVMMECEREVVKQKLESYDIEDEKIQIEGAGYKNVLFCSQTYMCGAGNVTVERHLFRPDGGGRCVCPLELRAGIVVGLWTPLAARQAAYAVAHLTPVECETLFDELGSMSPSHSSLDRLPKALSERWEAHREEWEEEVRSQDMMPSEATIVAISLDGIMVPIRATELEEKKGATKSASNKARNPDAVPFSSKTSKLQGASDPAATPSPAQKKTEKKPSKPSVYKEAACGTVSLYNAEGERLETVYLGRMPEHKKSTLTEQLRAEYESIVVTLPRIKPVYIADGAAENWRFLATLTGGVPGTEVVDVYHAFEHLKKALDAYHGDDKAKSKAEFESYRVILKEVDDGVDQVIRTLKYRTENRSGKAQETIQEELTYFRNQRHRMNYPQYIRDGLPIGSGVVEAANKTLISVRCKRSGQSWTYEGGQGILTLRVLIKSERWDSGWNVLAASYKAEVIPLETRRRHLASVKTRDKAA